MNTTVGNHLFIHASMDIRFLLYDEVKNLNVKEVFF